VSVTLHHERANIYRLEILGQLGAAELAAIQRRAASEIRETGKIRLLVVLSDFAGWDASDPHDLGFYIRHGDDIERIAIVGDPKWRDEALMFAGAELRKGPVEFFGTPDAARAADWLAA
jgi:hypothetical protein